jgi:hypothetical protein
VAKQIKDHGIHAHFGKFVTDLEATMAELGHKGRSLAVLKVDIEGGEFEVFRKLFSVRCAQLESFAHTHRTPHTAHARAMSS